MNWYGTFWGKARPGQPDGPCWHPNAFHCLDVGAVAEALLRDGTSRPPPPWDSPAHHPALTALVALHDVGKFSRPFQAKAPDHWPPALGPISRHVDLGHGGVGLAMLSGPLDDLVAPLLPGCQPSERGTLLGAVCGHHGRPVGAVTLTKDIACAGCLDAARSFTRDVLAVLSPTPLPETREDLDPALAWWLAGLAVVADWIGSAETWFGYEKPDRDLATYWHEVARPRAAAAIAAAGLSPRKTRPALTLADLVGAAAAASPVQALSASLELGAAGPLVVLIEDQTGSGKTEAALLLAHRLMVAGRADGVFVALPTMATANAMYERLATSYRLLFDADSDPSLVLAHGRRDDHALFRQSILAGAAGGAEPAARSAEDETASAQCAAWLADDRRRVFLAHVGVGTIDQALLGVLPTRHAPLRLHGLHRRVLIIDEAHAYDPYMNEELCRLLTFQAGLGGCAIVLSATLPSGLRGKLAAAFAAGAGGRKPVLAERAYPLVTVLRRDAAHEHACPGRDGLARRVAIERVASLPEALALVVDAAGRGAAVAWVRNAVDDAAEAHAALAEAGIAATLFHSRFAMGDRQAIEGDVMRRFGKDGTDRAGVVVATQVIEQSLDIDFDLMVTDLAPMDLLIQRAGRVWRHARAGRPLDTARLVVLAPEPVAAPAADWLGAALRRAGRVYEDHALLWRTARVLFEAGGIVAPGDVRRLVEAAYASDEPVPAGLRPSEDAAAGKAKAESVFAKQNLLQWLSAYRLTGTAWVSEERMPTRLGEPGVLIRLARWTDGALTPWHGDADPARAWALSELSLAPWIADRVPPPAGAAAAAIDTARLKWNAWSREIPVLALEPEAGGVWTGTAERGGKSLVLRYDEVRGLRH